MKRSLRMFVEALLSRYGYYAIRPEEPAPVDLRFESNHPYSLPYYNIHQSILINAPIELGLGLRTVPLSTDGVHPYVIAALNYCGESQVQKGIRDALSRYYSLVQPASSTDWLGLTAHEAPGLDKTPPWALTMPWDVRAPREWQLAREQFALKENREAGNDFCITHGWHFWGPVSDQKLNVEAARIHSLMKSLLENGLQRHSGTDGDVRAVVLRGTNGSWRWQVAGGEHRAAALSALGYKEIPVRVTQIINREDVSIWPNVLSGVFTEKAALRVFDSVFEGSLPPIFKPWIEELSHKQPQTGSEASRRSLLSAFG